MTTTTLEGWTLAVAGLALLLLGPRVMAQDEVEPDPERTVRPLVQQTLRLPRRIALAHPPRVGWWVTSATYHEVYVGKLLTHGGHDHELNYAVVGETETTWRLEMRDTAMTHAAQAVPAMKDWKLGVTIGKSDGRVLEVRVGRPRGPVVLLDLEAVLAGELEAAPSKEEPAARAGAATESVETPAGTFAARRTRGGWTATEGILEGLAIKVEGGHQLATLETDVPPRKVAQRQLARTVLTYTSGYRAEICEDPVVACFFPAGPRTGYLHTAHEGRTFTVTGAGTDARPTLSWPEEDGPR